MELNLTAFETAIKNFLDNFAKEDATFAVTYAKENKSIKECCQYICGEVGKARKAGTQCVALSDEEVYGLAIHYYDEDDIKVANNVVKPTQVATSAPAPASEVSAEQSVAEAPNKTRKPRKSKATTTEAVEDENLPEPFEMPLF